MQDFEFINCVLLNEVNREENMMKIMEDYYTDYYAFLLIERNKINSKEENNGNHGKLLTMKRHKDLIER